MRQLQVFQKGTLFAIAAGALLSFQNCSNNYSITQLHPTSNEAANGDGSATITTPPATTTVCDPFGGTGTAASQGHGLAAQGLYYVAPDKQSSVNNFSSLVSNSSTENISLILSQINVPNVYFSQGFTTKSGDLLLASDNSVLTAYFGFTATGFLTLGQLPEGDYQIASITDDGSLLTLAGGVQHADGTVTDFVINNDGNHSMKMACSSDVVHLDAKSKIPLSFSYYQGPPTTIGLMLMIRPAPVDNAQDAECGKGASSDQYFFNDTNYPAPSVAQQPYLDVQSRGWAPIDSSQFVLPDALNGGTTTCSSN